MQKPLQVFFPWGGYNSAGQQKVSFTFQTEKLRFRMKVVMNDLVHVDQVRFIPGREEKDNRVRTLLLVKEIKKSRFPGLLLSIDTEKAFDRVDWGFMRKTLEVMGIGPNMTIGLKHCIIIQQLG